jgi:hypothetical protein
MRQLFDRLQQKTSGSDSRQKKRAALFQSGSKESWGSDYLVIMAEPARLPTWPGRSLARNTNSPILEPNGTERARFSLRMRRQEPLCKNLTGGTALLSSRSINATARSHAFSVDFAPKRGSFF